MVFNTNTRTVLIQNKQIVIFIWSLHNFSWVALRSIVAGNWIWGSRWAIQAAKGSCRSVIGRFRGNPECCVYKIRHKAAEGSYTETTYLHNLRVGAGGRTLRFTDEVWLWVCAAETLVSPPQAPVTVWCGKTQTVTLFTCEVSGLGGRENNKLAAPSSSAAAVLETSCIVQACKRDFQLSNSSLAKPAEGIKRGAFPTTGRQADVEQRLVAEFRRVIAEHGLRPSNSHPFLLEPADQAEQLAVTLKGVTAQVAARDEKREESIGSMPADDTVWNH